VRFHNVVVAVDLRCTHPGSRAGAGTVLIVNDEASAPETSPPSSPATNSRINFRLSPVTSAGTTRHGRSENRRS
jgi:hypothetical protein